jgi:WD40 repeat protein
MKLTQLGHRLQAYIGKPILVILFVGAIFLPNAFSQDYTHWHLPEGAKARLGKGTITGNVQYSSDGSLLAVGSSVGVWLYDADTHEEINLLTGHASTVSCIAFSPDGQTLASGSSDGTIRLWNPHTGQHKTTLMRDDMWDVTSVAFSPDSSTLASGGGDGTKQFDCGILRPEAI